MRRRAPRQPRRRLIAVNLLCRYGVGLRRTGLALLAATPVVDIALLAVVAIDLAGGGTSAHALSAVYLGVSIVFGRSMIEWADVRVAHRFAGGPPPPPKPTSASGRTRRERSTWYRHAAAWAIGASLLLLATLLVDDPERTAAFTATAGLWTLVLAIDAAFSLPPKSARP